MVILGCYLFIHFIYIFVLLFYYYYYLFILFLLLFFLFLFLIVDSMTELHCGFKCLFWFAIDLSLILFIYLFC